MNIRQPTRLLWIVTICAVSTLVYLIRLNGATDLESYGQPTHIGYLLDLMTQGHIFVQRDLSGSVFSQPPLHTWLMAAFVGALGLNRLALTLPSFLAVLALSMLVFASGRRRFGELAGGLGAMAVVLSPASAKHIALVGAEPLLALTVTVAALAAYSARSRSAAPFSERQRWLLFWLMGALSTLSVGLLGIVLAAGALLGAYLMAARDPELTRVSRPHLAGLALFSGVVLAWLIPAGFTQSLLPTTQIFVSEANSWKTSELMKPVGSLLIHYLPFSVFLMLALWRVLRHAAEDFGQRGFERFLSVWIVAGLLAVSLIDGKGANTLFALWPACALLVGREMANVAERMGKTRFAGIAVVIGCVLIGATYNAVHSTNMENYRASALGKELRLAADAELAAKALKTSGINVRELYHFGTPQTLQLYLGTFRPLIDQTRLDAILATANGPIDLATGSDGIEALGVHQRYPATKQMFRWPNDPSQQPVFQIYRIAR